MIDGNKLTEAEFVAHILNGESVEFYFCDTPSAARAWVDSFMNGISYTFTCDISNGYAYCVVDAIAPDGTVA